MAEMAARAALREGRGAAAKAREASERRLVGEVASHQMVEQLLLERMLQQLACRGEGALLGRASGQMLDELLADTLCRHALRLSRRQSRVADSRVLGAAHRLNPNPNPNPNPNSNPNPNPNLNPNPL